MQSQQASKTNALPHSVDSINILIVAAPYYADINKFLLKGACEEFNKAEITFDYYEVPGALEIPLAIKQASHLQIYDGYLALGCVIRGSTYHFEIVAQESARGIMTLGTAGLCIGNGVLTVENMNQALVRADPNQKNKGGEAAQALLSLVYLAKGIHSPQPFNLPRKAHSD